MLAVSFFLARVISVVIMNTLLHVDTISVWSEAYQKFKKIIKRKHKVNNDSQLYYSVDFILTNIWVILDAIVVKIYFSIFTFGLYSSYSRIINGISSLSVIFTNVVFKAIAQEALYKKYNKLLKGTTLLFFSGDLLFCALCKRLFSVQELLGKEYIEYTNYLPYMFIPVWIKWISSCLGIYLLGAGGVKKRVMAQVIAHDICAYISIGYNLG
ncbi:hypothetical protein ACVXHB_10120 [Escherichia coli]